MSLRHPSRLKPVPRPQLNIMARALSASDTNINLKRITSATFTPIPPLQDCDSVISCPGVVKVPERVEQIQLAQSSGDILPLARRRTEPEILMCPWISVSASQGDRPVEPKYTQLPVLHVAPHQERHNPAQLTVPALSNAPELSMECPQLLESITFQQQQLLEDMDIDLDCPQSLMHGLQQYSSSTTDTLSPACPQFHPLQNEFTNAPQSQFPDAVSGFSSGRSFSYGPHIPQCTWEPHSWGDPSLLSPQEPFSVGSCAHEWASLCPSPATMTLVSQPHVIQSLQDVSTTETFTFNVHPETPTPNFGFSQQLALANTTRSSHAECISTGNMSLDEKHDLLQTVSPDHVQMQLIGQNVHQPQTQPVSLSDHQPEIVPRPSSPVNTVKAKGEIATYLTRRKLME